MKQVPDPEVSVIVALTEVAVLYEKPVGAVKIIVPLPVDIARPLVSATVGPVRVVHVAVPFVVFVSALIALPPVAGVATTAAKALFAPAKKSTDTTVIRSSLFFEINLIYLLAHKVLVQGNYTRMDIETDTVTVN